MTMRVPVLDLKDPLAEIGPELEAAAIRVVRSGWYILGKELETFEAEFAAACEARHAIGVGNGLEAISLILKAAGIGADDEVIVASNTYIATWLGVSYAGAILVPVEPDILTYNLDPSLVEAAVTPKTRAIFATDLYGQPADVLALREVADKHGLRLFTDAAQAHHSKVRGAMIGSLADATAFSFYPTKNLGALGDAGAVTTNDPELADRVKVLRNYGSRRKYDNEVQGVNSRLDEMQAALLRVKLAHLGEWTARRTALAKYYLRELAGVPNLTLPFVPDWAEPCWHVFIMLHPERERFQNGLAEAGVGTLIYYPTPPHLSKAYCELGYKSGDFPLAEKISDENIGLPMSPYVTDEQAAWVVEAVKRLA